MSTIKYWDTLQAMAENVHTLENDLKMSMTSPVGVTLLWVLVEGEADMYFYERMFDTTIAKVCKAGEKDSIGNVNGGNKAVVNIVGHLLHDPDVLTSALIGVIDRDWRPFKKNAMDPLPEHIFETDWRDLEMTLLSHYSVRNALENEVTSNMAEKHRQRYFKGADWYKKVWNNCCNVSRYMGSLHIVASHFGYARLLFSDFVYWDDDVNKKCLKENWQERVYVDALRQLKPVCHLRLLLSCWYMRHRYLLNKRPIYDVCRGHDFMHALSCMLIDKHHFSEEWMTYFMTQEISLAEIRNLQMYKSIQSWTVAQHLSGLS